MVDPTVTAAPGVPAPSAPASLKGAETVRIETAPADSSECATAQDSVAQSPEGLRDELVPKPEPAGDEVIRGTPIRPDVEKWALVGLFVLGVFFALYLTRVVFFPIILAVFLNLLLSPVVAGLEKLKLPRPLAAIGVLLAGLLIASFGVYQVSWPASQWLNQAPNVLQNVEQQIDGVLKPMGRLSQIGSRVSAATSVPEDEGTGDGDSVDDPVPVEVIERRGMSQLLFATTQRAAVDILATMILLYFLLSGGDRFLRKMVEVMPTFREKRKVVEIAHSIQWGISTYLLSVTIINCGLGVLIALAMWLFGMPNPILWGVMGAAFNFIPYVGAISGTIIIGLVALATFKGEPGYAMLVPVTYFLLTALEGNFITPTVLGYRLDLNPVVIFAWLLLWGFLWGVAGALMAVPMLAAIKILCDHIQPLHNLGKFLVR